MAVAILVMAMEMAVYTAPPAAVTMGALDETGQGVASAFNSEMGLGESSRHRPLCPLLLVLEVSPSATLVSLSDTARR